MFGSMPLSPKSWRVAGGELCGAAGMVGPAMILGTVRAVEGGLCGVTGAVILRTGAVIPGSTTVISGTT